MKKYQILQWAEDAGSKIADMEFENDEACKSYLVSLNHATGQIFTAEYKEGISVRVITIQ